MMVVSLEGKVALVTGASRGIGAAIAREFAETGAEVIVNFLDREDDAHVVVRQLVDLGVKAYAVQADVSDPEQVKQLCSAVEARSGRIDILVNNAGITADRSVRKMTDNDWARVIQTNLSSVFWCSRAVLPGMVARATGRIINIASVIGQVGGFGQANYAAAKGGVIALTKTLALETARQGVTVNAVCPGYIDTEMLRQVPEHVRGALLQRIPMARFGTPEEIASCVRFLATDGSYLTGQCLNPNGGFSMA